MHFLVKEQSIVWSHPLSAIMHMSILTLGVSIVKVPYIRQIVICLKIIRIIIIIFICITNS